MSLRTSSMPVDISASSVPTRAVTSVESDMSGFGDFTVTAGSATDSGSITNRGSVFYRFEIAPPPPCNAADLAAPFGTLDIADVVLFLQLFGNHDPAADLSPPAGVFDIADVVLFLQIFGQGCP